MRKKTLAVLFLFFTFNIHAAEISAMLYSFSPLAQIYLKHLGLEDKNNNGVIDKDADEGYDEFTAKYGNADNGFHANGVAFGAKNGKLEEPEIINHYYLHIRFKQEFEEETAAIESEVKAYIYANNLPLVWLDDEQGTVMNAVNNVLGEGWNEQEVSEDEAIKMFDRALNGIRIRDRPGIPRDNGGYHTLPEFILKKEGYCFEKAQFGFWFFSELKINSLCAQAYLSRSVLHEVVKLKSGKIVDHNRRGGHIPSAKWETVNPLRNIALFYDVLFTLENSSVSFLENAVKYDKYYLYYTYSLMYYERLKSDADYKKIITLGEFALENISINSIIKSSHTNAAAVKERLKYTLLVLGIEYDRVNDMDKLRNILKLLNQNYKSDKTVKQFAENYSWMLKEK